MKPDKINKLIKRLAAVSLWLIIWQIASVMTGLELLLASPVTVLRTLAGMLVTRQFYGILYLSVMHIMSGMLAGCLIGICAGILSARFDFLKEWLGIAVQLMKSLPVAAFIILVLMVGLRVYILPQGTMLLGKNVWQEVLNMHLMSIWSLP